VYDLARALNAAQPLHQVRYPRSCARPITAKVLNYYAYKKAERYQTFRVAKRQPGEFREVKSPEPVLKHIQRLLLLCLSARFPTFDKAAHGFVPGCSVLTNARPHVGRRLVLNVDIRQFFPSTKVGRVARVLQLKPFEMKEKLAYVANLCCDQGSLPQGAPTSPFLANVVCQQLDRRLRQLAARHHCIYTRYADDLTFSSNRSVFTEQFHKELNAEITKAQYELNEKKQRLQTRGMRQEVTGVVVNEKPNVSRKYRRQLRAILHNWSKDREQAIDKFRETYTGSSDNHLRRSRPPSLARVIAGKIAYLGMIRGKEDALYQSLATRLALLDSEEFRELSELVSVLQKLQQLTITGNSYE
jgi:RNA-directed DNA polymerase